MINKAIVFINLILIPIISFTQNEKYIFSYLKNRVKTVKLSKREKINYEYKEGLIIEKENNHQVERHYYYKQIGLLDSIIYFETWDDTTYSFRKIYEYNDNKKLVRIGTDQDINKEIIKIDSFIYNDDNSIDTVLFFSNKTETIFGTERTDSIRLCAFTKFEYDEHQQLIKEKSNQAFTAKEVAYFYDEEGNISKIIQYFGQTRSRCFAKEDESYSVTFFTYNDYGLPLKEIIKLYLRQANGKIKRNGKIKFRKKYYFY